MFIFFFIISALSNSSSFSFQIWVFVSNLKCMLSSVTAICCMLKPDLTLAQFLLWERLYSTRSGNVWEGSELRVRYCWEVAKWAVDTRKTPVQEALGLQIAALVSCQCLNRYFGFLPARHFLTFIIFCELSCVLGLLWKKNNSVLKESNLWVWSRHAASVGDQRKSDFLSWNFVALPACPPLGAYTVL